jgi:hypothetical protein
MTTRRWIWDKKNTRIETNNRALKNWQARRAHIGCFLMMWNIYRKRFLLYKVYRFIRRLSWSPDGKFFLTPASVYQDLQTDTKNQYTIYGFLKKDLTQPAFMLPGIKCYATSIKFNPYLYNKIIPTSEMMQANMIQNSIDNPALLELPYRIVFACATTD